MLEGYLDTYLGTLVCEFQLGDDLRSHDTHVTFSNVIDRLIFVHLYTVSQSLKFSLHFLY